MTIIKRVTPYRPDKPGIALVQELVGDDGMRCFRLVYNRRPYAGSLESDVITKESSIPEVDSYISLREVMYVLFQGIPKSVNMPALDRALEAAIGCLDIVIDPEYPLKLITSDCLKNLEKYRLQQVHEVVFNHDLMFIKSFFARAKNKGYIETDPFDDYAFQLREDPNTYETCIIRLGEAMN